MHGNAILTQPEKPFAEPWQAQAFAITLALHSAGVFGWAEWTQVLGRMLQSAPDGGEDYYRCWVRALEELLVVKVQVDPGQIDTLAEAWHRAARETPHGHPVIPDTLRHR